MYLLKYLQMTIDTIMHQYLTNLSGLHWFLKFMDWNTSWISLNETTQCSGTAFHKHIVDGGKDEERMNVGKVWRNEYCELECMSGTKKWWRMRLRDRMCGRCEEMKTESCNEWKVCLCQIYVAGCEIGLYIIMCVLNFVFWN